MSIETQKFDPSTAETSRTKEFWNKHKGPIKAAGMIAVGAALAIHSGAELREVVDVLPAIGSTPGAEIAGDAVGVAVGSALIAGGVRKLETMGDQQAQTRVA